MSTSDPVSAPIRVAEVRVATHQWEAWCARAETVSRRARRVAVFVGVLVSGVLAIVGLVMLSSPARISVTLYAPAGGAVVWALTRQLMTRRGLSAVVAHVRGVLVPVLVGQIDTPAVVTLLQRGGALVPSGRRRSSRCGAIR